jgi:hypothetical protein
MLTFPICPPFLACYLFTSCSVIDTIPTMILCYGVSHSTMQKRTSIVIRLTPLPALLVRRIIILRHALKSERTAASYVLLTATVSGIYTQLKHHKYIQVCSNRALESRFEVSQAAGKQLWPNFLRGTYGRKGAQCAGDLSSLMALPSRYTG